MCISNLSARPWKTWTMSKWLSYVKNEPEIVKEDEIKEEPKIEEPKTLEVTDNKEVKPDIPVEDKKEEVKEEPKTLFEKIWDFILKILDLFM